MKRIEKLVELFHNYNPDTFRHCQSVGMHMLEWADYMGFSTTNMQIAYYCGLMHDIGRLCLPGNVFNKFQPLSDDEQDMHKLHTVYGWVILNSVGLEEISPIVRYHHERYDGTGYQEGLKAAEIPFLSRMLSICDAFDKMTNRQATNNLSSRQALQEVENCAGTRFDPWLCQQFISYIRKVETIRMVANFA